MHHVPLSAYVLSKLRKEGGSKGNEKEGGREGIDSGSSMKIRDFVLFTADSPEPRRVPGI